MATEELKSYILNIANSYIGKCIKDKSQNYLQLIAESFYNKEMNLHPLFDSEFYLAKYSDIKSANIHPLLHYLCYGWREGRWPNRFFDPAYYSLYIASDINFKDPLYVYLFHNKNINGNPHPLFDIDFYTSHYRDVENSGIDPLEHFILESVN